MPLQRVISKILGRCDVRLVVGYYVHLAQVSLRRHLATKAHHCDVRMPRVHLIQQDQQEAFVSILVITRGQS